MTFGSESANTQPSTPLLLVKIIKGQLALMALYARHYRESAVYKRMLNLWFPISVDSSTKTVRVLTPKIELCDATESASPGLSLSVNLLVNLAISGEKRLVLGGELIFSLLLYGSAASNNVSEWKVFKNFF